MKLAEKQHLVLGPPGCGKTTRLLAIAEKELSEGVDPNRIAYVSFTKKAVEEATTRAMVKFKYKKEDLPYFRTLHSLCFQLLRLHRSDVMTQSQYKELGLEIGYEFSNYSVLPEDGMPISNNEGDRLLFVDHLARNRMVSLEDQWHEIDDSSIDLFALKRMRAGLERFKQKNELLDFTDMLQNLVKEGNQLNVDVVIIDEAQDLSNLQWEVCKVLFGKAKRVYIAGDDDQAIYKWSGADIEQFLSLGGDKEVLSKSYRLSRTVYTTAVKVIERIRHRFSKTWSPRDAEGSVNRLPHIEMVDFEAPGSWLILARNGYLLNEAAVLLRKAGFIFTLRNGQRSVETGHYLAILAWEKLRKGGSESGNAIRHIYDCLRPSSGIARGFKGTAKFHEDEQYTMDILQKEYGLLAKGIWHDALDGIDINTREYYLTTLRAGRKLSNEPQVKISTIHGAKGGEADNVVLLTDMSYKTFLGYQKCPDDEQRTFYVGMTRARSNLILVDSKSLQGFDTH